MESERNTDNRALTFSRQESPPHPPVAVLFSGVGGAFPPHLQPTGVPRGRFGVVVVVVVGLPQTSVQAVHLQY